MALFKVSFQVLILWEVDALDEWVTISSEMHQNLLISCSICLSDCPAKKVSLSSFELYSQITSCKLPKKMFCISVQKLK